MIDLIIKINDVGQSPRAYNFIKNLLELEKTPSYILICVGKADGVQKIIPIRWLYQTQSTDFYNLILEAFNNTNKYEWGGVDGVEILIRYEDANPQIKKKIIELRTLYDGE